MEQLPPGVRVLFPGGAAELELDPARSYSIGRFPPADVQVVVEDAEALEALFRGGWGGRTTALLVNRPEGWTIQHLKHQGRILHNGRAMFDGIASLRPGDRIAPSEALVFRFE